MGDEKMKGHEKRESPFKLKSNKSAMRPLLFSSLVSSANLNIVSLQVIPFSVYLSWAS